MEITLKSICNSVDQQSFYTYLLRFQIIRIQIDFDMDHAADSIATSTINHLLGEVYKNIQLKKFLELESLWFHSQISTLFDIVCDLNSKTSLVQDEDCSPTIHLKEIKVIPRVVDKFVNLENKELSLNSHRSEKHRNQCQKQSRRIYRSSNHHIEKEEVKIAEKPKNHFHVKYKACESRKKIEEDDGMKFPVIVAAKVNPKMFIKPNRVRSQSHQIFLGRKESEIKNEVQFVRVDSLKKKSSSKNDEIQPKMKIQKDRIYINRVKAFQYFPEVMKGKSLINGELMKRSMLKL